MKGFCPNCNDETRWAVNEELGERICMRCNRVEGF